MDFAFSEEQEQLRRSVREFIEQNFTNELKAEIASGEFEHRRGPHARLLFDKLAQRGWVMISWPKDFGGQGGRPTDQYIVEEELVRAGLPVEPGGSGIGAVAAVGTDAQREEFLEATIRDDLCIAMALTEPGAGTDLAALQCRAVREDDDYVINGQKTFISAVHEATHIYLMVRTDPDAGRHGGISILLVPVDTPGITIRPLWTVQNDPPAPPGVTYGMGRTNEVFFDNVRVPTSCLLGKANEGWGIGQAALSLDRVGANRYLMSAHIAEEIVNLANSDDLPGSWLADAPVARDVIAELWTKAQVCRLFAMRSLSIIERGEAFSYEPAAEKVWGPEFGVRAIEAVTQLLGPYAQLLNGSAGAIRSGLFAHELLGAYQSGVNHGSVQIMRDQVARRGLNMPSQSTRVAS